MSRSREAMIPVFLRLELISDGVIYIHYLGPTREEVYQTWGTREFSEFQSLQGDKDCKSLKIMSCERWLKKIILFGKVGS